MYIIICSAINSYLSLRSVQFIAHRLCQKFVYVPRVVVQGNLDSPATDFLHYYSFSYFIFIAESLYNNDSNSKI